MLLTLYLYFIVFSFYLISFSLLLFKAERVPLSIDYRNMFFFTILFFFVALMGLLRLEGRGPDYFNYVEHYLGNSDDFFEIGYEYICEIGRDLNVKPDIFFFLCFWLGVSITIFSIYKHCKLHNISYIAVFMMYFSYLFYLHSFTQIRIGLALALLLFIYSMDKLNKSLRVILSFSGVLFHSSSIIFIIVYLFSLEKKDVYKDKNWKRIRSFYIALPFLCFLIMMFLSNSSILNDLLLTIEVVIPRAGMYVSSSEPSFTFGFSFKQYFILSTLLFYWLCVYSITTIYSPFELFCLKISTISISLFILLSQHISIAYRVFELFELFFIFLVSFLLKRNVYVGVSICVVYILISLRAVFFIDSPLFWIEG